MRTDTDIFNIGRFGWPPDVHLCTDLSATSWLNDARLWSSTGHSFIGKLIPHNYARYVRVNHPAWKDPGNLPNEHVMWDQHQRSLQPVSWAEVARWSGRSLGDALIFDDVLPERKTMTKPPFDGEPQNLSPVILSQLIPALRSLTTTPHKIWMGFCDTTGEWDNCGIADVHDDSTRPDIWERRQLRQQFCHEIAQLPRWAPPRWVATGRSYWLGEGPLDSVYDISRGIYDVEPFLWWPNDHAWFISHDIDLDFSLIGTTEKGLNGILGLPYVEAYKVW